MKITVLNGSPKGDLSVTMQYILLIKKKYPQHEFEIINIAARIKKIEKDEKTFGEIIDAVEQSDGIIWGFPLYVGLVASQYKRFIELIWERNAEKAFAGKHAVSFSTSIHFYDNIAHNYMHEVCDDLDMNFVGFYSPDMYDIMQDDKREQLLIFAENFFTAIEKKIKFHKENPALPVITESYVPGRVDSKLEKTGKKILVVADLAGQRSNLENMVNRFSESFSDDVEVININDVDIKGGCLGCCECGFDNECVYERKDGFIDFYNEKMKKSDIVIFASEVKDRYLSAKIKEIYDRGFFNTHTPTLTGKQIGFIVSGPLSGMFNLRQLFQAYSEWQLANMAGFVSDEGDSAFIDENISNFAERILSFAEKGFLAPPTFLGVGGMKIFRDDIWGRLRFVFQADHAFYEKNGFYDFPQNDLKAKEINEKMYALTGNPEMRQKVKKMIKVEMVKPHQYIVENK